MGLEQGFDEGACVEHLDIFRFFSNADELHRHLNLISDTDDCTTFGCAIELCQEKACDIDGASELFSLDDGILAVIRIEDQQNFMGRAIQLLPDDALDFLQFLRGRTRV